MHYSVGALIQQDDKYLLINRAMPPLGFAGVAGHIDEDETSEEAVVRELMEEVGLHVVDKTRIAEEWIDCAVNPLRKADVIFLLDISADEYQRRVQGRERYISPFPLNHLEKVRARYLDLCEDFGFDFLDGSLSKEAIAVHVLDRARYLLEGSGRK